MAKIAIVTPFPPHGIGGGETFVNALYDEASKENEVEIITIDEAACKWQGTPIKKSLVLLWKLLIKLYRRENSDSDIYHAQGLIALMACVVRFRWFGFKRPKILVTMLALYNFKEIYSWKWLIINSILRKADKIFVEGETGLQDVLDIGICGETVIPFWHWVDLDKFKPIPKIRLTINVLFVGRPIRIKGKHIIQQTERMMFYNDTINFRYIENLQHDQLIAEYQNADVLVVPSIYSEGFPRVIFEAAACGCTVIASNRGALPELVTTFGYCVEPTANEFYRVLLSLKIDHLDTLAKGSRKYAERFFSPKNAEVILREYK